MKKVYVSDNPAELHILMARLEGSGILAHIENEDLAPLMGSVPENPYTLPALCVIFDADYDRAMGIIEKIRTSKKTRVYRETEVKCPLCNSRDLQSYKLPRFFIVTLTLTGSFLVNMIVVLLREGDFIFVIGSAIAALFFSLNVLWLWNEGTSRKRRYICGECGMKWSARGGTQAGKTE